MVRRRTYLSLVAAGVTGALSGPGLGLAHEAGTDPLGHATGSDSLARAARTGSQTTVTGRLTGPNGLPVPDADVWAFDAGSLARLATASTARDGSFTVDVPAGATTFLFKKDAWFGSILRDVTGGDRLDAHLDRRLLSGPAAVTATDGTTLGLVSLWRALRAPPEPPHAEQMLFLEVTNVAEGADRSWAVMNDDTDPSGGIFTLSFPEADVLVNYGSQTPELEFGPDVRVLGAQTRGDSEPGPISKTHPLHPDTPFVPSFPLASQSAAAPFRGLQRTGAERGEVVDEGIGRLLGTVPMVSTVVTWADTIAWAFGNPLDEHGALGPTFGAVDPNRVDTVVQGWTSPTPEPGFEEAAVVFAVPFRLEVAAEETTEFTVQAEWETGPATATWSGQFGRRFWLGPTVADVGAEPPAGQAGWPMFQFDAANTGHKPDANAPRSSMTQEWATRLEGTVSHPVVADETVYVGDGSEVVAINRNDGSIRWQTNTNDMQSLAAVGDGQLYVSDGSGALTALDVDNGSRIWTNDESIGANAAAIVGDTIYTGGEGYAFALRRDGTTEWRTDIEGFGRSRVAADENAIYAGCSRGIRPGDGALVALDVSTGAERWRFTTDSRIQSTPGARDGTVYVGTEDTTTLYALDGSNGEEQWRFDTGDLIYSSPAITDTTVYVASYAGVHALDAQTGDEQWHADVGEIYRSSPAVAGGTVYIANREGTVFALDTEDGSTVWQFSTSAGETHSSPAVASGTVYVGRGFFLYALTEERQSDERGLDPMPGRDSPPTDPDGDGLYEDVNGDGETTPGDATVLFNNVFERTPAVTEHSSLFDFNGDGGLTPGDATVLFGETF